MTGKRLHEAYAEVNIVLKKTNSRLFPERRHNVISIRIQPDAGISMRVNAKSPVGTSLAPVTMDFCHECEFGIATIEAYEKLIFDAMHGDQTLFTRWDEVRASWQFIDEMKTSQPELFYYPAGIEVPKEAHELLRKDGRKWVHWDPKFRAS